MNYDAELFHKISEVEDKLFDLIKKNQWSVEILKETYPITFRFRKGENSFKCDLKKEEITQLEFVFRSEIEYISSIPENQKVDEKFFNKLKNLCKEMHRLYLLTWFSRKESRFEQCVKQFWKTSQGDSVCLIHRNYQP